MPDVNVNTRELGITGFEDELRRVRPEPTPEVLTERMLDNVSFHDFAFYDYLLPTETAELSVSLSEEGLLYLDGQEGSLSPEAFQYLVDFLTDLEIGITRALLSEFGASYAARIFSDVSRFLYHGSFLSGVLAAVFDTVSLDSLRRQRGLLRRLIARSMKRILRDHRTTEDLVYGRISTPIAALMLAFFVELSLEPRDNADDLSAAARELFDVDYPFEVFASTSVNIGLRLVYRQEWKPLGMQQGEIVRTIPLAPLKSRR